MIRSDSTPKANTQVILREEFEDYALLFDPVSGKGFGLSDVGVTIWRMLDGRHSVAGITSEIERTYDEVPEQAEKEVTAFVNDLVGEGLAFEEHE